MKQVACLALMLMGSLSILQAAPSGMPVAPLGDAQRAAEGLQQAAVNGFVQGDWGLKMLLWKRNEAGRMVFSPLIAVGGTDSLRGPWQRVMLQDERQYLIEQGKVWDLNEKVARVMDAEALRQPVVPGASVDFSDFAMLFLRWPMSSYEGVDRIRGRYCDVAVVSQPEGARKARVWVDVEFGVPMQAELLDAQNTPVKQIRAVSLQKSDDQWILRRWRFQDLLTKQKVDIEVVATAFNQNWPRKLEEKTAGLWPDDIQWKELE